MSPIATAFLLVGITASALAQEQLWEVPGPVSSAREWYHTAAFRDYDGDGAQDLLVAYFVDPQTSPYSTIEILSGRSGQVLWNLTTWGVMEVQDAGDCDGDGYPDLLMLMVSGVRWPQLWSTRTNSLIWQGINATGSAGVNYGATLLGDVDLDGDGLNDVIIGSRHPSESIVSAYGPTGTLLWQIDYLAQTRIAYSISKYGDFNGDGCDDFLLGLLDGSGRGVVAICSGLDGSYLQESFGTQPGNALANHVKNVGDINGDGVHDYVGFPEYSTTVPDAVIFSGADGSALRIWTDFAESVVAGPDFDLDRDGVPDLIICDNEQVVLNSYGKTRAISGRDGTELWNVFAQQNVPGSGVVNGYYGWGRYSTSLGTWPGRAYPSVAWIELGYWMGSNGTGRVRAFGSEHIGQGPVKGHACSSIGTQPLIGARKTQAGARITLAKAPPGAFAVLAMSLQQPATAVGIQVLPLELTPIGMPGCFLQVSPDVVQWRVTGTGPGHDRGYCYVDLPFQLTGATTGTSAFAQWLAFDLGTLDFAASEVHSLRGQ
tara:strand:+ start:2350 stop:3981 length:1632 start_codon:yes stop_codon:yes gene_type:complete